MKSEATDKNWRVINGKNYVAIEHTYTGKPTWLNTGDVYTMTFAPEGAAALTQQISMVWVDPDTDDDPYYWWQEEMSHKAEADRISYGQWIKQELQRLERYDNIVMQCKALLRTQK